MTGEAPSTASQTPLVSRLPSRITWRPAVAAPRASKVASEISSGSPAAR